MHELFFICRLTTQKNSCVGLSLIITEITNVDDVSLLFYILEVPSGVQWTWQQLNML